MYWKVPQTGSSHLDRTVSKLYSFKRQLFLTVTSEHRVDLLDSRLAITCKSTSRMVSGPTAGRTRDVMHMSTLDREIGTSSELDELDEREAEIMCCMEKLLGISICKVEDKGMLCLFATILKWTLCASSTRR